jgi:hypothetical protein
MARRKDVYEKIRQITDKYLLRNVGELAVTGWPRFDEDRHRWIVTVLCETPKGALPAGRIELDEKLNLTYVTPRDNMVRAVEEQLRHRLHLVIADEEELKSKGFEVITL